uniref:Uncharacterized protein n=1 Tax=Lactuca sativa TaxID=4236 RepID=A0A9R1XBK4_LACSA|nr:hypothetical protein LSAT_V11C500297340 [Lactuca sativa]
MKELHLECIFPDFLYKNCLNLWHNHLNPDIKKECLDPARGISPHGKLQVICMYLCMYVCMSDSTCMGNMRSSNNAPRTEPTPSCR